MAKIPESLEKVIDYAEFKTLPVHIRNAVYQVLLGDAAFKNKAVMAVLGMEGHKTPEVFLGGRRSKVAIAEVSKRISETVAVVLVKEHLDGFERLREPFLSFAQFESLPPEIQKEVMEILYVKAQLTLPLITNIIDGASRVNFAHITAKIGIKKEPTRENFISISEALDQLEDILAKHNIVYTPDPKPKRERTQKGLASEGPNVVSPQMAPKSMPKKLAEFSAENAEVWEELETLLRGKGGVEKPMRLNCYEAENSNLAVCYFDFLPGGTIYFYSYNEFETHDRQENPSGDTVYIHVETSSSSGTQTRLRLKQFLIERGFRLVLDELMV